jgi:hypothetical protein
MHFICIKKIKQLDEWIWGRGSPRGLFPARGRGREKSLPVNSGGDGGGEFCSPRGRGWEVDPRRGIPRCHPYPHLVVLAIEVWRTRTPFLVCHPSILDWLESTKTRTGSDTT